MLVVGYSANQDHGEAYQINVRDGQCAQPNLALPISESGISVGGQPSAISRLIFGVDPALGKVLEEQLGVPTDQVPTALQILQQNLQLPVIVDAMPIQDTLDLAEFLVDVTIKVSRFMPGFATVGGPIELAAITRHEGFRWIKRKHFYPPALNQ